MRIRAPPRAAHLAPLLADFWDVARRFVVGGPAASSSIVLSAPAWDERFDEWRDDVFPLLEESLLACGLGRTLGIVCFHPSYTTPPPAFLARRRFGHMHGLPTLRGWLDRAIVPLFRAFAELCFREYGSKVKHWVTFNEAWTFTVLGYGSGSKAPGRPYTDIAR